MRPCRFCNKTLGTQAGESRHALYHCKKNPNKRKPKVRVYKKRKCKYCKKLLVRLKPHMRVCKVFNQCNQDIETEQLKQRLQLQLAELDQMIKSLVDRNN